MGSDGPSHVRVRNDEPEHDGQAENDEGLGIRVSAPGVEVDHERGEHERRRRQHPVQGVELPLAGEVRRKERQHEETCIPRQPNWLLVGEAGSEACDLDRDGCGHGEDERLEPAAELTRRLVVTAQNELLPQPAAVLARELPGKTVEVPEPLHGDQERLVRCQAGRVQLGDLVAKMILELVDVVTVDARSVGDVGPPLCDL